VSKKRNRRRIELRRPTLPGGVSDEAKAVRLHYLRENAMRAVELAGKSPYADPVVIFVDPTDGHGRSLAAEVERWQKEKGVEAPFTVESADNWPDKDSVPLMTLVVDLEFAKQLMSVCSDTATKSLDTPRPPGFFWAVCIARNGNTYGALPLLKEGLKLGHHRDGGTDGEETEGVPADQEEGVEGPADCGQGHGQGAGPVLLGPTGEGGQPRRPDRAVLAPQGACPGRPGQV